MNRKVTNRFFAGLCFGLGLMACTLDLKQEQYNDFLVGLEGDEIALYPLGETITFPVYYLNDWELDHLEKPDGVSIYKVKESNSVKLDAVSNETQEDREGSFDIIAYDNNNIKTIQVSQPALIFSITDKDGKVIGNKSDYVVSGGEISLGINTNVNFKIRSSREDFKITDTTTTSFKIDASSTPAMNGEDISGTISVDLYDKAGEYREKQNYYAINLLQKAFLFKWTDPDVDPMEVRKDSVGFNDLEPKPFSFISSGKWQIKDQPEWLDVTNKSDSTDISKGDPGEYTILLGAKVINTDNQKERTASLSIITDEYPDNPLVINLTQGKAPQIGLKTYRHKLIEGGHFTLEVDVDAECEVEWVSEKNGIVTLSTYYGKTTKVTALTEGKAEIRANITVDGYLYETDPCVVTVYREYKGGNTGEEIGDDKGEW